MKSWSTPRCTAARLIVFFASVIVTALAADGVCESSNRLTCLNNLRNIAVALNCYEEDHGHFPPAIGHSAPGQPAHSWRVLLLPYLEQQQVFEQYKFDEPWNGPNNATLLESCPSIYRCPSRDDEVGHTTYVGVVGSDTLWPSGLKRTLTEITDGPSVTLAVVESPTSLPWTQPGDPTAEQFLAAFEFHRTDSSFGHVHRRLLSAARAIHAVRSNCEVAHLSPDLPLDSLSAMLTVNGGESISKRESFTIGGTSRWRSIISLLTIVLALLTAVVLFQIRK